MGDPSPVMDEQLESAVRRATRELDPARRGPGSGSGSGPADQGWEPLRDVLDVDDVRYLPAVVLPGLAWAGRLVLFAGDAKLGKSTLLSQAVGCRATGEAFAGSVSEVSGAVAIVTEEPPGLLATRLRRSGIAEAMRGQVYVVDPGQGADRILAACARRRPALVVVDSFTAWAVAAGAESLADAAVIRRAMNSLRDVVAAGAAVLVVHHLRKSDGQIRDSSDLAASADMLVTCHAVDPAGERVPFAQSDRRRLSYVGRWPQDSITLDFDRRTCRYLYVDGGSGAGSGACPDGIDR